MNLKIQLTIRLDGRQTFLQMIQVNTRSQTAFLDDHAYHITVELIELARENYVILFRLPAHTSHFFPIADGVMVNATPDLDFISQDF